MASTNHDSHFLMLFWFIVGLCVFGMAFTVFLIIYLPTEASERIAESSHLFWLTSAVGGGIGYLIGSSAQQAKKNANETTISTPQENGKTTFIQEPNPETHE